MTNKFKAGDKVVPVAYDCVQMKQGHTYTIHHVTNKGCVVLEEVFGVYRVDGFKLVEKKGERNDI